MNAPRNDKDHFLYPYEIVVKIIYSEEIKIIATTQGYRNLAIIARKKERKQTNKQCMNALLPQIRQSLFRKAIMEYLILLKIKSKAIFKYSQVISLHISMWRFVR